MHFINLCMYIVFGGDFGVNQVATWYRVCRVYNATPCIKPVLPLYINYTYIYNYIQIFMSCKALL